MVELLKRKEDHWSKADAFLLPLTGLGRNAKFECRSYLFWREYSIHNYNLILTFSAEDYTGMLEYCKKYVFPVLDKKGYLIESYDMGDRTVFVLDMSEWAMDIEFFLIGKYSKFSKEARSIIEKFHALDGYKIPVHVYATLYPNVPMELLENMSPLEYVSQNDTYGFNMSLMKEIGEIGTIYDEVAETLLTDIEELCKSVTE